MICPEITEQKRQAEICRAMLMQCDHVKGIHVVQKSKEICCSPEVFFH